MRFPYQSGSCAARTGGMAGLIPFAAQVGIIVVFRSDWSLPNAAVSCCARANERHSHTDTDTDTGTDTGSKGSLPSEF
jgi:hypothetical protein